MRNSKMATAFVALASLITGANAHSWVQQLNNIGQNLSFVGAPGYPRGYVQQYANPQWSDASMVYLLPPDGGSNAYDDSMFLCKDTQRTYSQTQGFPMLQVTPGDAIALQYQENGHTTQPNINAGKAPNGGTVYIYGTASPKTDEKFTQVHKVWNADGTGGDKRGKLLATRDFDDKRCYQQGANSPIAQQRMAAYPVSEAIKQAPMELAVWCQNDFTLPTDMPVGKPYTLYWIWDWPTTGLPAGNKNQSYQTCMDVQVVAGNSNMNKAIAAKAANIKLDPNQINLNFAGNPSQVAANNIMGSPASGDATAAASGPVKSSPAATAGTLAPTAPAAPAPSAPATPAASSLAELATSITSTSFMTVTVTPTTVIQVTQTGSPAATSPAAVTKTVEVTIMQTTTVMETPAASSGADVHAPESASSATVSGNFFQTAPAAPGPSSPSASMMPSSNCTKTAKKSVLFGSSKTTKRGLLSKTKEDVYGDGAGTKRDLEQDAKSAGNDAKNSFKAVVHAINDLSANAVEEKEILGESISEHTKRGLVYDLFHPRHHDENKYEKRHISLGGAWDRVKGGVESAAKDVKGVFAGKKDSKSPASNYGEYFGSKRGLEFGKILAGTITGAEKLATEVTDKVHGRGLNRLERARELRGD